MHAVAKTWLRERHDRLISAVTGIGTKVRTACSKTTALSGTQASQAPSPEATTVAREPTDHTTPRAPTDDVLSRTSGHRRLPAGASDAPAIFVLDARPVIINAFAILNSSIGQHLLDDPLARSRVPLVRLRCAPLSCSTSWSHDRPHHRSCRSAGAQRRRTPCAGSLVGSPTPQGPDAGPRSKAARPNLNAWRPCAKCPARPGGTSAQVLGCRRRPGTARCTAHTTPPLRRGPRETRVAARTV